MKFKVGDEVKIVYEEGMGTYGIPSVTIALANGNVKKVAEVLDRSSNEDEYKLERSSWIWPGYMLQAVASPESIHITRDGDTVHAIHKRNGEIVKRTKAVCDPRDEFEFGEGAKRAFARVMGIKTFTDGTTVQDKPAPEPIKFNFDDYKAGKFAVHCTTEHEADIFLAYLHGRGFKWVSGRPLIRGNPWRKDGPDACYHVHCGGLFCDSKRYCASSLSVPVIPFCQDDL